MAGDRKKSWREIDRMKDRGGRSAGKRNEQKSRLEKALEDPRLKEKYLKEAEKLFMGAKGRPEHEKDLRTVHESYGTDKFRDAVLKYVEKYGMPDDWSTLLLLLDLKEEADIVCQAMEILVKMAGEKSPVERKGLKSKLKVLSMTSDDPEIQETAEAELASI